MFWLFSKHISKRISDCTMFGGTSPPPPPRTSLLPPSSAVLIDREQYSGSSAAYLGRSGGRGSLSGHSCRMTRSMSAPDYGRKGSVVSCIDQEQTGGMSSKSGGGRGRWWTDDRSGMFSSSFFSRIFGSQGEGGSTRNTISQVRRF